MPFHVRFRAALKRKMHVFESIPSVDAAAAVSPYLVRYPSPSARRIAVMPPVLPSSSTSFSNSLFSIQRFAPSLARYKDASFARSSLSVLLSALPSFSWIFPFFFFYPLSIPYVFFPRPIRLSIFSFYFIQRSEADGVRELLYRLVRILQGTSCSALERRKSVKSWWSGSMLFQ